MKNVSINLLTNVLLLLVGVILIIFHAVPDLLVWAVRLMGTMFMVLAVVYMVTVAVRHAGARTSSDYMGVMPAVGGLCFGLVLMLKAPLFDAILQQLMGMLLVVLGGFHIVYLWMSRDKLKIGGWYYVLPVIVVLCGILSMVLPALRDHAESVVLVTGICLLLFNFTSLQEYLAERRVRRALGQSANLPTDIEDDSIIEQEESTEEITV